MEQLRLRELLMLSRIDELGSLGAVARAMNVTQPAVTQALRVLEQAFGTSLVERGPRGVVLQPAGRAALERLRIALQEVAAAQDASQRPDVPLLRLGASPTACIDLVPRALGRLRDRLPQTQVVLIEKSVPDLWRLLAEGELDALASRAPGPAEAAWLPPGVHHERLGSDRMVIVGSARHPLARRRATPSALAACDWVLPPPGSLAGTMFAQWLAEAGLAAPEAAVRSVSFHTNLRMVSHGSLLTVAPESAVLLQASGLRLKVIATPWSGSNDIVFAHRDGLGTHRTVQALRACFVDGPAVRKRRAQVSAT